MRSKFLSRKRGIIKNLYQRSSLAVIGIFLIFIAVGILTTIPTAYRLSSPDIQQWTEEIEGSAYLYLFSLENRLFREAYPDESRQIQFFPLLFQMATKIKPDDPRSLLGREIPGFSIYDSKIIVAGEGTDYTTLPIESSPPMEVLEKDHKATVEEKEPDLPEPDQLEKELTTNGRQVVFIYSTHNRESFLPHLPEAKIADEAFHPEVNITLVNERLAKSLENYGIGAVADQTDIYQDLLKNNWDYSQSYQASRSVVASAIQTNKDIQFVFDLHRDAQPREITTKTINGEDYARVMFIIGRENPNYEQNIKLATALDEMLNKKYPGISRGVEAKGGPGNNGVYNQDLSSNAILIEFGGVENRLNELYRTADVFAEVFSEYYWQYKKVNTEEGEE
ncbi:MAG: stage II sporulation protein P [Bacillaceae bacterium]|nr:stage II sporulation protein P [Bacillaceae bacterium]